MKRNCFIMEKYCMSNKNTIQKYNKHSTVQQLKKTRFNTTKSTVQFNSISPLSSTTSLLLFTTCACDDSKTSEIGKSFQLTCCLKISTSMLTFSFSFSCSAILELTIFNSLMYSTVFAKTPPFDWA